MNDNELIAEFMAVRKGPFGGLQYPQFRYIETSSGWCDEPSHYEYKTEYKPNQLKYHESWDWLMPVVEKIYSLGYFVQMIVDPMFTEPASCVIISSRKSEVINSVKRDTLIEAVYNSCVHFIRWYNANQIKST